MAATKIADGSEARLQIARAIPISVGPELRFLPRGGSGDTNLRKNLTPRFTQGAPWRSSVGNSALQNSKSTWVGAGGENLRITGGIRFPAEQGRMRHELQEGALPFSLLLRISANLARRKALLVFSPSVHEVLLV